MSQFDDDFQSVFDNQSFIEKPSLEEILGNPSLRDTYGYEDSEKNDFLIPNSLIVMSARMNQKMIFYFVGAEMILATLVLGFTFLP